MENFVKMSTVDTSASAGEILLGHTARVSIILLYIQQMAEIVYCDINNMGITFTDVKLTDLY